MVYRKNLQTSKDYLQKMSDEDFKNLLLEFRGLYTTLELSKESLFKKFGIVVENESGISTNLDAMSDLILDECVTRITNQKS
jgi:hypothetical protein